MDIIIFIAGLAVLIIGAEFFVHGASRLAVLIGVSPLVIGLTVVAFATSAPELAVSVRSAWIGQADLALGNVVGSNIFNVLFILGISALIAPLLVSQQLVRLDVPLMISLSVLLLLLGLDGKIGRLDGLLLFAGLVIYTVWSIRQSRKEGSSKNEEAGKESSRVSFRSSWRWLIQILFMIVGLALLLVGSGWLVDSAVAFARALGVSELVIGLTIIAFGTSLPEVATSVVASIRGQRDMAVGNVVGSNIFNILSVLGVTCVVAPDGVSVSPAALRFDLPVMITAAVACLPIFFTGYVIARWEGAVFLGYYIAYMLYLILDATRHDALPVFSTVMMAFVIPLTVVTLLISVVRAVRENRRIAA